MHPYIRTGGLGEAASALARAQARRGHRVAFVVPYWRGIRDHCEKVRHPEPLRLAGFNLRAGDGTSWATIRREDLDTNLHVYFIDLSWAFDRPDIYGGLGGDFIARFSALCRGACEIATRFDLRPDILHAHDWQAALAPIYARHEYWGAPIGRALTVFTIHNIMHQGEYGKAFFPLTGLGWNHFHAGGLEFYDDVNLMKGALCTAHKLTTVSPRYASEITWGGLGEGLDGVLQTRASDLTGILNGIDTDDWNPARDEHLVAPFTPGDWPAKRENKLALQRELGLHTLAERPLFVSVSRLDPQKGIELILANIDYLVARGAQVAFLGTGDPTLEWAIRHAAARHPGMVAARVGFDTALSHRMEAGADFFLMPSRFEPCGLNQMISMHYGTLPVVRETGGLADTVVDADFGYDAPTRGNGFTFKSYDGLGLGTAIDRALRVYYEEPARFDALRLRGMETDFSWGRAAAEYERLYRDGLIATGQYPAPRR